MPRDISGGGSSFGAAASCSAVSLDDFTCHSVKCREGMEGITRSSSRAAATIAIHRAAPCAIVPPDRFVPGTDELYSGRHPASCHALRAINISERRLHHQQAMTQGFDRLAAQPRPAVAPAPRAQLYTVCSGKFLAAEAALGLQPAASAVSLDDVICQMQGGDGGNYTIEQQSSCNHCDSSRCTVRNSSGRPVCPRNRRAVQQ
jgi:hypothetical protein